MNNLNPYSVLGAKAESLNQDSAIFVSSIVNHLKSQNPETLRYAIIGSLADCLCSLDLSKLGSSVAGVEFGMPDIMGRTLKYLFAFSKLSDAVDFSELLSDSLSELYSENNGDILARVARDSLSLNNKLDYPEEGQVQPISFSLSMPRNKLIQEEIDSTANLGSNLHYYYVFPKLAQVRAKNKVSISNYELSLQLELSVYLLLTDEQILIDVLKGVNFKDGSLRDNISTLPLQSKAYLQHILYTAFCSQDISGYTGDTSLINMMYVDGKSEHSSGDFKVPFIGKDSLIRDSLPISLSDPRIPRELKTTLSTRLNDLRAPIWDLHSSVSMFPLLCKDSFNIQSRYHMVIMNKSALKGLITSNERSHLPDFYEFCLSYHKIRMHLLNNPKSLITFVSVYNMGSSLFSHIDAILALEDGAMDVLDIKELMSNKGTYTSQSIVECYANDLTDIDTIISTKVESIVDAVNESIGAVNEDAVDDLTLFVRDRVRFGLY